jgi:hypothetical protein
VPVDPNFPPPTRKEAALINRVLGGALDEFVARFGADDAAKRIKTEMRRARQARSRKLYLFWSAMLARIHDAGLAGDPPRRE